MQSGRRLLIASLLTAATTLLMPGASQAGTVHAQSLEHCGGGDHGCGFYIKTVSYSDPSAASDAPGEVNTVTISAVSSGVVSVRDETSTITIDPNTVDPCELKSEHEAWCELSEPGSLSAQVQLGGLDDTFGVSDWGDRRTVVDGGPGDDLLTTGSGNDKLSGDTGHDVLDGRLGDDDIGGGEGTDTANYSSRTTPVVVNVGADGYDGEVAEDERDNVRGDVERVLGGTGKDDLTGNALDNLLAGNGGDDRLDGGTGKDVLSGGAGNDTISYASRTATQPVAVRLDGVANDGAESGAEGDQDYLVENVTGGAGADRLTGNNYANVLAGGGNADRLDGGFGSDTLDGGQGLDTAFYGGRTAAVAVLLDGARNDGSDPNRDGVSGAGEERDLDVSIENATGGEGPDLLRSLLAGSNILTGNGGGDRIFARDGGTAKDYVNCGAGTDHFQADPSDAPSACEAGIP